MSAKADEALQKAEEALSIGNRIRRFIYSWEMIAIIGAIIFAAVAIATGLVNIVP